MKKLELKSQMYGDTVSKTIELFNKLLEESNFELDQFVKNNVLSVSNEVSEQFVEDLNDFISAIQDAMKEIKDTAAFWNMFYQLEDYEQNKKFISWIEQYLEATMRPIQEAAFINKMSQSNFEFLCKYCFENLILQDIGKTRFDKDIGDTKQLLILKKIIFTFVDMVVVKNYSRENSFENMKKIFDIKEPYCEFLWRITQKHEEKLWKIMMMKQYDRINNKLDRLIDILEE